MPKLNGVQLMLNLGPFYSYSTNLNITYVKFVTLIHCALVKPNSLCHHSLLWNFVVLGLLISLTLMFAIYVYTYVYMYVCIQIE